LELCRRLSQVRLIAPAPPLGTYRELDGRQIVVRGPAIPGHAWEQAVLPQCVRRRQLLWSPGGSGPLCVARRVLTIHDVAPLEHPEWYDRRYVQWYRLLLPLLARRVQHILTPSQFSRDRIVRVLRVPPERVTVTPLGVDPRFRLRDPAEVAARLAELGVRTPFLLAVSAVSERKNFRRLFAAWRRLAGSLSDLDLVVVGQTGLRYAGRGGRFSVPERTRTFERVSDEDLVMLYNGALAFIYPSLYEGFGLPILEAMACGTPVMTSCTTSMPEVAGGAALLIDPYDVEAIGRGLRRIAEDERMRSTLRARGLDHVRSYSYDYTAVLTGCVLEHQATMLGR
jgi:glycosyltransferase involved in cell wall biosynthesis